LTRVYNRRRSLIKRVVLGAAVLIVLVGASAALIVRQKYYDGLKPISSNAKEVIVTIPKGATISQVALALKDKGLLRDTWIFEWYIRTNDLRDKLQAGTYKLSTSQSVPEYTQVIISGKVATDLITILPAQRLDQIKKSLVEAGYSANEVEAALDPGQYAEHPALADKPAEANLEGYIYPESFQKTADTKLTSIVTAALDEMDKALSQDVRKAISKQGLTVHEAVILASIVEQEVSNSADRKQAAQVFIKRLKIGMQLGSDVTAFYGAALLGVEASVSVDSPYNTRLYDGLPPGPISNVSRSSLEAIAYPADSDYLFFVAGDDGTTHFSKTIEEHEALTAKYCTTLCGR
jgi:UPF0755 protein